MHLSVHAWYIVGVLCVSIKGPVEAAKLRSWVGPNLFFEGQLPQIRANHGFTSNDDAKIYLFGGFGANGNKQYTE